MELAQEKLRQEQGVARAKAAAEAALAKANREPDRVAQDRVPAPSDTQEASHPDAGATPRVEETGLTSLRATPEGVAHRGHRRVDRPRQGRLRVDDGEAAGRPVRDWRQLLRRSAQGTERADLADFERRKLELAREAEMAKGERVLSDWTHATCVEAKDAKKISGEPGSAQVRRREQRAGQLRALRQPPSPRGLATMADADAAMALALADGRALLTIENRDLGTALVEHVVVDWPGVSRCPITDARTGCASAGAGCASRTSSSTGRASTCWRKGTSLPGGLTRISLAFEKGRIVVSGGVSAAGRDADFKGRVRLGAGVGRRLRISVEDIRVQGAPPLPLSAIASAVLSAFSSHMQGERTWQPAPDALDLDVLRPALDELLVAEGWRLPDSSTLRLSAAVVSVRGLELSWGQEAASAAPQAAVTERTSLGYEAPLAALRRSVDDAPPRPRARGGRPEAVRGVRARERRARRRRRAAGLHRERRPRHAGRDRRGGGWSSCSRGVATRTPRRGR
jgi:hypothetical protein